MLIFVELWIVGLNEEIESQLLYLNVMCRGLPVAYVAIIGRIGSTSQNRTE
jgi:hypothetical protein